MKVYDIGTIDFNKIYKIMRSSKLTVAQKEKFVRNHSLEIKGVMKTKLTSSEFTQIMNNRPLIKYRPLKNSFTKAGDKKILAQTLGVPTTQVTAYITETTKNLNTKKVGNIQTDKLDTIKTYVYRHGSKDELVAFLDYELQKAKDITKALYKTLEYYSGGVADYFIRPIHRMDNKTLIKIFQIINKNIKQSQSTGQLSDVRAKKLAKWALIRIYQIQNNSKLINAIKTYNVLK